MKTPKSLELGMSGRCDGPGDYEVNPDEAERSTLCLSRQIHAVEELRLAAFRRLAKTIALASPAARRAVAKGK
jgi:hypothetical protein